MIKGRPPRLAQVFQTYDPPLYFVTICTIHRDKIRNLEATQRTFEAYIRRARDEFGVAVGKYMMMPDHMHFFVRGGDNFNLAQWVNGLKRAISVALGATKKTHFGSRDSSITYYEMTRATLKNGNMCARILYAQVWCSERTIGPIKVNSC